MKTIAWDVDDVLNDLMRTWLERFWMPAHPDCPIGYEQVSENPPHSLLGVSLPEYQASLDDFRLSESAKEMPPVPEVLAWFQRHGVSFRHMALTATPLSTAPTSAAWVMRHFGRWIRSFHVVPSPRQGEHLPAYDQSKEDFLRRWHEVDILVDDNPLSVAVAQALGIQTILWPRPWNQSRLTLAEALAALTA
ncbi:hypothetical protein ACFLX0_01310 [Chloroflexota bacterium]